MTRTRVVVVDGSSYSLYRRPDRTPYLDPREFEVTLLCSPTKDVGAHPDEVARVVRTDTRDAAAVVAAVAAHRPAVGTVDRVVALGEFTIEPAAALRAALGVPGLRPEQARVLRDKPSMKAHFAAAGVAVPEFMPLSCAVDATDLLRRHGRIVVKPTDAAGSRGYREIVDPAQLVALDRNGDLADAQYYAEQFMTGSVHHVDSVVRDGRPVAAHVSHYLDREPEFAVGGRLRSVEMDPGPVHEVLAAANRDVLRAIGWFSGVVHVELFLRPDGTAALCEIAGRAGGAGVVPSFGHRFGIDMRWASIAAQLGLPVPGVDYAAPGAGRRTGWVIVYPPTVGTMAVPGPLPRESWMIHARMLRRPGDVLTPPVASSQGIGVLTVAGTDTAEVTRRLELATTALTAPMRRTVSRTLQPGGVGGGPTDG